MADYEKMYFELSAKVANAIDMLVTAQREAEEEYCNTYVELKNHFSANKLEDTKQD